MVLYIDEQSKIEQGTKPRTMSDLTYEEPKVSKWPIVAALTRVTTLVSLVVGMALLRTNSVTYTLMSGDYGKDKYNITYHDVHTYKYVFFGAMAAFIYTILQIPFDAYFLLAKKRLINSYGFLLFEFYADKLCMLFLATVVGAVFGATVETRYSDTKIVAFGDADAKDYRLKIREFCMIADISGGFLLLGFLCSIVSSIMSSKALRSK